MTPPLPLLRISVPLEVPFHDVDQMGIVWHGHYLKYFELARTALMRRLGMDFEDMGRTGCGWPVVHTELKYLRPLRYGQRFLAVAALEEYDPRIRIAYELQDAADGSRLTRGHTLQLPVDLATGELRFEAPAAMADAIRRALALEAGQP